MGGYIGNSVVGVEHPSKSALNATTGDFTGAVTADAGVAVDNITIDGTEIDLSSGDLTLDVAGDIILDAAGAEIKFANGGTVHANHYVSSSNYFIYQPINDKDIVFQGTDNSATITALTLDMSEAGAAAFNAGATFADSVVITTADNTSQLVLTSTDADSGVGPRLDLTRDSGSPADNDALGRVRFLFDNDAGQETEAILFTGIASDVSDGTEDAKFTIATMINGTNRERVAMTDTEVVFNEDSIDSDFRVEGNGNANAFFVQGSDDFIGIGTNTPKKKIHIQDTTSDGIILMDMNGTSTDHQICFAKEYGSGSTSNGKYYAIGVDSSENALVIAYDNDSQASLSADKIIQIFGTPKCVGINSTPTDQTLKIGNAASSQTIQMIPSNASLAAPILQTEATRGQSDVFDHIKMSNNNGGDLEFKVRGDGQVTADGAFSGGGADYAEYFEWTDGNSSSEDRRGYSVVLDGNKVRKATSNDAATLIIGIVSARPVVVGDTAWNHWTGRWERDDYGDVVKEAYTVTTWDAQGADSNGVAGEGPKVHHSYHTDRIPDGLTAPSDAVVTSKELDGTTNLMRPKEASNYDASQAYVPRENRVEWDAIGMVGKLRMRKGQPTGDRWIKLRDISSDVEEWLVR